MAVRRPHGGRRGYGVSQFWRAGEGRTVVWLSVAFPPHRLVRGDSNAGGRCRCSFRRG